MSSPAKKTPKTTELTAPHPRNTSLVPASEFEAHSGAGLETVNASDLIIPRLSVLQQLSPQLNRKKPEFIEGAEIGHIVDVGTGDLFKEGIVFLPVLYRKEYLEWAPRASGKGLVKIHTDPAILETCIRNDKNQPMLPNGNYVAETAQFFGLNLTASRRKCFLPMTSTQLKKARKWITQATSEKLQRANGTEFMAPLFYRTYNLTTAEESNNEGDWAGWKIERGLTAVEAAAEICHVPWPTLRDEVLEFLESLKSGRARGDMTEGTESETSGEKAM